MDSKAGKAQNDHNVYILGAGFAAQAGLPLIKDFMNRMRDAAAWLAKQDGREQEVAAIERVLEFRLKAAAAAYRVPLDVENVEELFSLAAASTREKLTKDVTLAIAATLDFARCDHTHNQLALPKEYRFYQVGVQDSSHWKKPESWDSPLASTENSVNSGALKGNWYSCPPYDFFAGIMGGYFNKPSAGSLDTIVTFNYDLAIETALYHLKIPFSYGMSGKSVNFSTGLISSEENALQNTLRVLKLHGSVNWAIPGGPGKKLTFYENYDEVRKNNLNPLLVPPTWRKHFAGQLADIWDRAVDAIRIATRIIIIGYSMPSTDVHFRYLLAAGLQDNISLRKILFVNPGLQQQDTGEELRNRLAGVIRPEHFTRGIVEFIAARTSEFFLGPKEAGPNPYRGEIGRPMPSAIQNPPQSYMVLAPYF